MNQHFAHTVSPFPKHFAESYTFSAKEKDAETGLSYFGARYYSSDLSIWLSVDPMSEKYPYQSNYVYCSNNPLKVIDPNGEDEWEVNKSGHIRHVDGSEGMPDKLFAVRGFGANKFRKRTDIDGLKVDGEIMKGVERFVFIKVTAVMIWKKFSII
jgi:RHS repeat-associated protein